MRSIESERQRVAREPLPPDALQYFSALIYAFPDRSASFDHQFVSEVCESNWYSNETTIPWAPIEICLKKHVVRDWRGRCQPLHNFLS